MDVGQPEIASGVPVGEVFVLNSQQVKDRGVEVVDVDLVDHRLMPELIGLAVADAALDAAAAELAALVQGYEKEGGQHGCDWREDFRNHG